MKVETIIDYIQLLLAKDEVEKALNLLVALMKDMQELDSVIHQSARYTRLLKDVRSGVLLRDEYLKELNTIRLAILDLLKDIRENNQYNILNEQLPKSFLRENSKQLPSSTHFSSTKIALYIGTILSAIGITLWNKAGNFIGPSIRGDNSGQINQVIIGDSANNVNVQINDSPLQKSQAAYNAIRQELIQNILTLSTRVRALSQYPPQSFSSRDKRRLNEPEAAYQDRAKLFHTEYKNEVQRIINKFGYKTESFSAHKVNLAFDQQASESISKTYYHFEELQDYSNSIIEQFNHILSLKLSDTETNTRFASAFDEKLCEVKSQLCQAASYYLFEEKDLTFLQIVKEHLKLADIVLKSKTNSSIYAELLRLSAYYQAQKAQTLKRRYETVEQTTKREIERRIKDPYLVFLRKLAGLPNELTESELWALSKKQPDETINDLEALMTKASFSYIESDGTSALFYLTKALKTKNLNTTQKSYLQKSIERLNKPELYEGCIGFYVFDVENKTAPPDKYFQKGDIIFKINNTILEDASDISNVLGKTPKDSIVVFDVSDGKLIKKISAKGGKSLGVTISPLITVNFTTQ